MSATTGTSKIRRERQYWHSDNIVDNMLLNEETWRKVSRRLQKRNRQLNLGLLAVGPKSGGGDDEDDIVVTIMIVKIIIASINIFSLGA